MTFELAFSNLSTDAPRQRAPVVVVPVAAEVVPPPVGSILARVSRSVARVARSVAGVARGAMRGALSTVRAWGWTV